MGPCTRWLGMLGVLMAAGCGSGGPKIYTITGQVTLDGHPVEKGEIIFLPVDEDLAPDSGKIRNGTYTAQVKAGPKRVEIRAFRELPEQRTSMGPVFQQYIPECYHSPTCLTADITASGKKEWDFPLKSSGP